MPRAPASKASHAQAISSLRLAHMPLHRAGKDTFTTRHYCRRGQPGQSRCEWHNDTLSANTRISQFAALQVVA